MVLKKRPVRLPTRILLLAAGSAHLIAYSAGADEAAGARFELPIAADAVVIEYTTHGSMQGRPEEPLLRIFAGGRVEVNLPKTWRRDGLYELQLSQAELEGLVGSLVESHLMELDSAELLRLQEDAKAAEVRAGGMIHAWSESQASIITVRLAKYRAPGAEEFQVEVEHRLIIIDPREYAEVFPSVPTFAEARYIVDRLRELLYREDLECVPMRVPR